MTIWINAEQRLNQAGLRKHALVDAVTSNTLTKHYACMNANFARRVSSCYVIDANKQANDQNNDVIYLLRQHIVWSEMSVIAVEEDGKDVDERCALLPITESNRPHLHLEQWKGKKHTQNYTTLYNMLCEFFAFLQLRVWIPLAEHNCAKSYLSQEKILHLA